MPTGWWHNLPKYMIILLKAWYGEHAQPENEFGYDHLPKLTGDHSQLPMTLAMVDGVVKGQFVIGQNPVVGAVNSELVQRGLAKLDWLVVRDFAMTETANFWQKGSLVQQAASWRPTTSAPRCSSFPSAMAAGEGRHHDQHLAPGAMARQGVRSAGRQPIGSLVHLSSRPATEAALCGQRRAARRGDPGADVEYPVSGDIAEPDAAAVLREINGYTRGRSQAGQELSGTEGRRQHGVRWLDVQRGSSRRSTTTARGRAGRTGPGGPGSHQGWAFAWPDNRRTLYNRASADLEGKPWSERKRMVWWDAGAEQWTGTDTPDFVPTKPPDMRPDWSTQPKGMDALGGDDPFIMEAGRQVPAVRAIGPEGRPVADALRAGGEPGRQSDVSATDQSGGEALAAARQRDPRAAGSALSLRLDHIPADRAALRRHIYACDAPHRGAAARGVRRDLRRSWRRSLASPIWTGRCSARRAVTMEVKALVTRRCGPSWSMGGVVHEVGMPWVFGWEGYARGAIANVLLAIHGDPNTSIHTTKALTCALRKGRLARRRQRPWPMTFTPRRCWRSTSCWRSGRIRSVTTSRTRHAISSRCATVRSSGGVIPMPNLIASGWH